ncbi:P-loop containing nucleoside triphosphate hydrolase protein [Dothidotthia symphoricarpi CBS 119687]|uniref:P-loop containing nucleoside triphosphate hydrolase protein n=1 Tax=Dothidotthia symphoricarpi CBS 119687 TaxID=1392245 RepID=A0A6A6AEN2_9PLEO|nr:P-loop containing nucleoside triphosphate hydrolase protein [Dothidotthia symphoricarpi CBS 119687]KAF2130026.1 P-loop containing nucleoside triphosphate hydrolase protein [Dothidotthia symphoricarpi CBS 119687]
MASIFTFDPDPPRVSSPWAMPPVGDPASMSPQHGTKLHSSKLGVDEEQQSNARARTSVVDYSTITRLEAEPQEGPTEYKLHLLLRRRRSFTRATTSTGRHISGSLRRCDIPTPIPGGRSVSESGHLSNTPPPLSSTQSRQHRLEQLTTQLLWRLQQSCPYHISSSMAPVLPHLPNDDRLPSPDMSQRLLPGLEESKGALYEIGVADDGTIVGLAEDEMEESLNNLRAMAESLGCGVQVLRRVAVGECEWVEGIGTQQQNVFTSTLLVAEALVRPEQHLIDPMEKTQQHTSHLQVESVSDTSSLAASISETRTMVEQLRVSLTGATTSGKSSLLGTLSTTTLDNGRGKSRLSLLRHRHEIASGMTSSVTQELIGYRDVIGKVGATTTQVISYGSGDVSSWIDIHASVEAAEQGRLIFLSDSAGHPRFRRTTVRGIVGWQPHWTLVCVPADSTDEPSGKSGASPASQDLLGPTTVDLDLSQAHLQLCLDLELPLVVVITKYDLATKAGLRQTLSKLLSALKDAGRRPCIISDPSTSVLEADLLTVSTADLQEAAGVVQLLEASPLVAVPIILTSAVKGTGINKLHAFLRQLPLPPQAAAPPTISLSNLFYIEDVYSVKNGTVSDRAAIIGGYLRYGVLKVGDELLLGPYPVDISSDDSDSGSGRPAQRNSLVQTSKSFPGALKKSHDRDVISRDRHSEWRRVRITSLRNLRLPVRTLCAGQVGTMSIMPIDTPMSSGAINRIRKGMVLADREAKASRVMAVRFEGNQAQGVSNLGIGSAAVVYVASVRASSKVVSVATETVPVENDRNEDVDEDEDEDAFGFGFDDQADPEPTHEMASATVVTFQFIATREFVEVGAKVLVMPGGGPGLSGGNERGAKGVAGLEGFVGRVVEEQ